MRRPKRKHTEKVPQIALHIQTVHPSRQDDRQPHTPRLGPILGAEKQPVLPPDRQVSSLQLRLIIVNGDLTVFQEVPQSRFLIPEVSQCSGQHASTQVAMSEQFVSPLEELSHDRCRALCPYPEAFRGG